MSSFMRQTGALAIVLALACILSACGGTSNAGKGSDSTATNNQSTTSTGSNSQSGDGTTTTSYYPQFTLEPPPASNTTRPTGEGNNGNIPINAVSGSGNTILIKPNGFWPHTLYANDQVPVTWINLSGVSQKVSFTEIPSIKTITVPANWSVKWVPNFGGSNPYRSASGFQGILVLQYPTPVTTFSSNS